MLLSDESEFWQNAAFGAIIGIIALLLMKLLDKYGGLLGENTPVRKRPTEHDERF